ncbi:hypothetical protein DU74_02235 [Methanosarcina mazei]|uniref:Glycosyltransferase n=1 Tax=Methanosarcina mazei TaxID=2209 RepID=A0A0F8Q122_METMZ|nr:glycosyltransferase [Methanosarcina mazei]KKH59375.1 hypothetical protein DU74_02235 [Methanosarcina mazei]
MKILQVIPYFSWSYGGPVRNVYELSKMLCERGHSVTIFTTDVFRGHRILDEDKIKFENDVEVRYFKCINNWLASELKFHLSPEMRLAIKNELKDFDVVHLHDYRGISHFYVQQYAKLYKVPYILQARGAAPIKFGRQGMGLTFSKIMFDFVFGQRILKDASKLVALTQTESNQYQQIGGDPSKIVIIPNGIPLSQYDKLPKKGEFRTKYSIKDDDKLILYLGRIHKIKGIDLLIKSFSKLVTEFENLKLVIVGPNDGYLSQLKSEINHLDPKIANRILYTGPIYGLDKTRAYVDADVYVLPSIYETFPSTVLEAFACSTPVVVTDRCGISNFVERVGYVVKYDEMELKNAISNILKNEVLSKKLGDGGRKLVETELNLDVVLYNIENLYREVRGISI